jgi:putative ABC transport system substrate-binding protein
MHRFAKWLFVLAMATHIVPTSAFADRLVDGVPIPNDAKVVPPSAAVPQNQQRFLGAWVGRWGGLLKHILIVESLQPDGSASVIYGWGDNPSLNITRGFSRPGANLSGDTLTIKSSFTATYKLTSATSATASYQRGESRAQADMVKLDLAALIASDKNFAGADAQRSAMPMSAMPMIGFFSLEPFSPRSPGFVEFRRGLAESGFFEGENTKFEFRVAGGSIRLREIAEDFLYQHPAVVVALGSGFLPVLKAATSTVPIVFMSGLDPISYGFVDSFNRPGGNVTGINLMNGELISKRISLLLELVPQAKIIGYLSGAANSEWIAQTLEAAKALGREIVVQEVRRDIDIEKAFASFAEREVSAVMVAPDSFMMDDPRRSRAIVEFAFRYKMPAVYGAQFFPRIGGLISYSGDSKDVWHQLGTQYIARILKGTKPADLPVQQPTKFQLVINLKTAKALGLTIPETLLATADEVIQ